MTVPTGASWNLPVIKLVALATLEMVSADPPDIVVVSDGSGAVTIVLLGAVPFAEAVFATPLATPDELSTSV